VLGCKKAIEIISVSLENTFGCNLRWSHVETLVSALKSYDKLSHIKRLKIMEYEFLSYVLSNLTTVGLDDNVSDMNLLKTEKANIEALK
jgi:hypothetical protein